MSARKPVDTTVIRRLSELCDEIADQLGLDRETELRICYESSTGRISLREDDARMLLDMARNAPAALPSVLAAEPELNESARYRTARKTWDCVCANESSANHRSQSPDCRVTIRPGDRYVDYSGESAPYSSGSPYCLPCGIATWNAARWAAKRS